MLQKTDSPVTNPILNNPYEMPRYHWQLDENFRAIDEKLSGRRSSGAYLSVPNPQTDTDVEPLLSAEATAQTIAPHPTINRIREEVSAWRAAGYKGTRRLTRELLDYWTGTEIEPRPFFCQIEALETLVWLLEAGPALKSPACREIRRELRSVNDLRNEGIGRLAVKMATGTGKTRVMAMIILWQALTRRSRTDILIITPNLTVRERLAELVPKSDSGNGFGIYEALCPPGQAFPAGRIHVTVKNFQAFQKRTELAIKGAKDTPTGVVKKLLNPHGRKEPESWAEDADKMINRLLFGHRGAKNIIVLNDEAHHCYQPTGAAVAGTDAEDTRFEEQAALWFNVLRTLKQQGRLGQVFDMSATPMYLRRPAGLQHDLFPWTVSDYPLIDAVEAGLTKIPRVPVKDDAIVRDDSMPVYRNIYNHVRHKNINLDNIEPVITDLLGQMHKDYIKVDKQYQSVGLTPVMIVVANTVQNANTFYKHIAGYYDEKSGVWQKGAYAKFSNVKIDGTGPCETPPTLLVHSEIDDSGGAGAAAKIVKTQERFFSSGEDTPQSKRVTDIRDAFNTVGRKGKLGEHIRCIISVSMLTEGWDARTVTHIFGYRKFGSQLLCEQVAGRALRRTSFPVWDGTGDGLLQAEYARIFGVPFSFMRGEGEEPPLPPLPEWPVFTVKERAERRIAFPNIASYRIELPEIGCRLDLCKVTAYRVTGALDPTKTTTQGIVGEEDQLKTGAKRDNEVIYGLAARAVEYFYDQHSGHGRLKRRRVMFASMLQAVRDWLAHTLVDCTDLRLLAQAPHSENVPLLIAQACIEETNDKPSIRPVFAFDLDPSQPRLHDTSGINFMTTLKHRYPESLKDINRNSELNAAACHSGEEVLVAAELDQRKKEIVAWARNYRLGWRIPYLDRETGQWRYYEPDFVARLKDNDHGPQYIIIEYKGQEGPDSDAKTDAVRNWWIPAVDGSNDPACAGTWQYVFINNKNSIYREIDAVTSESSGFVKLAGSDR